MESVSEELKSADPSNTELVDKIETYLSAVATNQYTCYDELVVIKSNIVNALAVPLNNVTQLYSVSLGLVAQALKKNLKKHKTRKHGLPTQNFKVRQPLKKLIKVTFLYLGFFFINRIIKLKDNTFRIISTLYNEMKFMKELKMTCIILS